MTFQVTHQSNGFRLGHRYHQHVARLDRRHRRVHHQVVALAAEDRARGARGARARHDLVPRRVDQPAAAGGLVDRRRTEPSELRDRVHSAGTTCGRTRWKASA